MAIEYQKDKIKMDNKFPKGQKKYCSFFEIRSLTQLTMYKARITTLMACLTTFVF